MHYKCVRSYADFKFKWAMTNFFGLRLFSDFVKAFSSSLLNICLLKWFLLSRFVSAFGVSIILSENGSDKSKLESSARSLSFWLSVVLFLFTFGVAFGMGGFPNTTDWVANFLPLTFFDDSKIKKLINVLLVVF